MIPLIQPPGFPVQQGWSPNALRPVAAGLGANNVSNGNTQLASLMGGVAWKQIFFNTATINALSVTPQIIVPGIAGFLMWPLFWQVVVNKTVASGGPTANIRLRHFTNAGVPIAGVFDLCTAMALDLANARTFYSQGPSSGVGNYTTTATPQISGFALGIDASAAGPFGGSDAVARVTVLYYQIPVPTY